MVKMWWDAIRIKTRSHVARAAKLLSQKVSLTDHKATKGY